MYISEELENSPLLYYVIGIALVISTIFGVLALFSGAGEKGAFILTISALFYVALYYRLFSQEDNHTQHPR